MTQQVINIGAAPNDGTGDHMRVAFDKSNQNFTELYQDGVASVTQGVWNYNQTSTDTGTSPVSGRFRTNSGNYIGATQIAIHATTIQGVDRTVTLQALQAGDLVQCQDTTNANAWCRYALTSAPVNNGTWFQLNVALKANGSSPSGDNQEVFFTFTPAGASGGSGNVSNTGTPSNGQLAQWTDATHIQGINSVPAAQMPALTGDVTTTAGNVATTIAAGAVTNAKLAAMLASSIKLNNTGGAAAPIDGTPAQLNTMLPVFGASGGSHAKGDVPDPGSTSGTTRYLREDASWQTPPAAPVLPGYIGGLTLANDGTTPATVIDIAAGGATSDDYSTTMILPSAFTKNCNAAWVAGSGNGGLDSGSTIPASAWLHVFLIMRTDTSAVDVLVSQSATSPTLPTNYTKKRRIGSIKTAASAILAFAQLGDEFVWRTLSSWDSTASGISISTVGTTITLNVPSGISVIAIFDVANTSNSLINLVPGGTPVGSSTIFNVGVQAVVNSSSGMYRLMTNTAQAIAGTANVAVTNQFYAATVGWLDNRGK